MTDISIVVPTKDRPKNIKRLVQSIMDQSNRPQSIQIIFRIDEGDTKSKSAIKNMKRSFPGEVLIQEKPHVKVLSDLWEDCYSLVKGPRVMMCADDVIFRTKGWDDIIIRRMRKPKKIVHFVWCNDRNQGAKMPTLPFMSEAWIKTVGYFVPRGYYCDYCDIHLQGIAERLKEMGHDVTRYLKNVIIEHMHPTANKADWDNTYKFRRSMRSKNQGRWTAARSEIKKKAKHLKDMIDSGKVHKP